MAAATSTTKTLVLLLLQLNAVRSSGNLTDLGLQYDEDQLRDLYWTSDPNLAHVRLEITVIADPNAEKNILAVSVNHFHYWLSGLSKEEIYLENPTDDELMLAGFDYPIIYVANDKSYRFSMLAKDTKYVYGERRDDGVTLMYYVKEHDLDCRISLENFPLDKHRCRMYLRFFGRSSDLKRIRWVAKDSVTLHPNFAHTSFSLDVLKARQCDFKDAPKLVQPIADSCLVVDIHLRRGVTYYFLNIYGPSIFILTVSWASFWLDPLAVSARTGVGVTSLLSLVTLSLRQTVPSQVTYLTAIDYWYLFCQLFAIATLVIFAVVNNLTRLAKKEDWNKTNNRALNAATWDQAARIVYPVCFVTFLLLYFFTVGTSSGEHPPSDYEYLKSIGFAGTGGEFPEATIAELKAQTQ